jgi:hypothetical protein
MIEVIAYDQREDIGQRVERDHDRGRRAGKVSRARAQASVSFHL